MQRILRHIAGDDHALYAATSPEREGSSGKYFEPKGEEQPSAKYYSPENERKVWNYAQSVIRPYLPAVRW